MFYIKQLRLPILFLLLTLSFNLASAQLLDEVTSKAMPYSSKTVDTTLVRYFYAFNFAENAQKPAHKTSALTVLEVGKHHLKYTDYFKRKIDSFDKVMYEMGTIHTKEINQLDKLMRPRKYKKNILINLDTHQYIVQGRIEDLYQYRTAMPKLSWKLDTITKTYKGFTLQKAITTYGGRDWVAWFCPTIKRSYGPYVFGGLPGLIFELYDTDKNFHFLLRGSDHKHLAIYLRNEDRIKKTTRKKYRRLDKAYHKNFNHFSHIQAWTPDGKKITLPNQLPYNPIEKE